MLHSLRICFRPRRLGRHRPGDVHPHLGQGKDDLSEQDFVAYLTTAVKNRCISFLRRKKDDTVSIDDLPPALHHPSDDLPADGEAPRSPEEVIALATLPPKCKDIFLMAKLKGMKYREIAGELGISEKTVDNQMTKAVKLLRAYAAENPFLMTAIGAIVLSILVNCH